MRANNLPSILSPSNDGVNTLSMERSLKQIKEHLENHWHLSIDGLASDSIQASIDDVDIMLSCIKREDEMQLNFKSFQEFLAYMKDNGDVPEGWSVVVDGIKLS